MTLTTTVRVGVVALIGFAAGAVWAQGRDTAVVRVFQEQTAAINARDAAKYAGTYAEDAVSLSTGQPMVKGRTAIQKDIEAQMLDMAKPAHLQGTVVNSLVSGELGYVLYSGSNVTAKGVKQTWHGVTVFRQIAGQWRGVADASMLDSPAGK